MHLVLEVQSPIMITKILHFLYSFLFDDELQMILNCHELVAHGKVGRFSVSRRFYMLRLLAWWLGYRGLVETSWSRMHH